MKKKFTHITSDGDPTMVDVGQKTVTDRSATARAILSLPKEVMEAITADELHTKKGPVFQTAILAGIMGAKKTSDLIPLCHPLALSKCAVDINVIDGEIVIDCTAKISSKTGVEMEALTGASVAALTIYDMCKGFSHDIIIKEIKLMAKSGGKADFNRP